MGLDIHSLNLLRLAQGAGADFSSVLTLGRLTLFLSDEELAGYCRETRRPWSASTAAELKGDGFCEPLLKKCFGAGEVVSLDALPYDGAALIHDLNRPLPAGRQFSAVLDFGCLEHVFNFPVAIDNVVASCRDGGHVLHVAPANNWCGHGFYQFSPELFFSLYSEARGFTGTQVFLVETDSPSRWYRLRNPLGTGKRINVINRERINVLVLTRKTSRAVASLDAAPQQSDYVAEWSGTPRAAPARTSRMREWRRGITKATGLSALSRAIRLPLRSLRHYLLGHKQKLTWRRSDMEQVDVASLLKP
jgi:hypothetical protein